MGLVTGLHIQCGSPHLTLTTGSWCCPLQGARPDLETIVFLLDTAGAIRPPLVVAYRAERVRC